MQPVAAHPVGERKDSNFLTKFMKFGSAWSGQLPDQGSRKRLNATQPYPGS
jgi:hypothetical protein